MKPSIPDPVDLDPDLRLTRWGWRFRRGDQEREYKSWRIAEAVPYFRVACLAATGTWLLGLGFAYYAVPDVVPLLATVFLLVALPLIACTFALSYLSRHRKYMMPLGVITNGGAGLAAVWVVDTSINVVGGASALMVFVAFFSFVLIRLPPFAATVSVLPGVGYVIWKLFDRYSTGAVNQLELMFFIFMPVATLCAGSFACYLLELMMRRTFHDRCIIETQQRNLEASRKAISRYVPPRVADQIIAGNEAAISKTKRSRVTILFADIVGFTGVADRMEPEDTSTLLNEYLSSMVNVIEENGGTLNEFAGDGLMALWGAPDELSPETQVRRAILASQAMLAELPDLNRRWRKLGLDHDLNIRVGINTGMASVGSYGSQGRMTYTAIGLQTNIAARIESQASPGEVLISGASFELIADEIACEHRGEIQCKGVHFPIQVYAPGKP